MEGFLPERMARSGCTEGLKDSGKPNLINKFRTPPRDALKNCPSGSGLYLEPPLSFSLSILCLLARMVPKFASKDVS